MSDRNMVSLLDKIENYISSLYGDLILKPDIDVYPGEFTGDVQFIFSALLKNPFKPGIVFMENNEKILDWAIENIPSGNHAKTAVDISTTYYSHDYSLLKIEIFIQNGIKRLAPENDDPEL